MDHLEQINNSYFDLKEDVTYDPKREIELIKTIESENLKILHTLLSQPVGIECFLNILEMLEKNEYKPKQVFKNVNEGTGHTLDLRLLIELSKKIHIENEKVRESNSSANMKNENELFQINEKISLNVDRLIQSLNGLFLKNEIIDGVEKKIRNQKTILSVETQPIEKEKARIELDLLKEILDEGILDGEDIDDEFLNEIKIVEEEFNNKGKHEETEYEEPKALKQITESRKTLKEAEEELIKMTLPVIYEIAHEYSGRGVDFEDLIDEGIIGCYKAYNEFELLKGHKFRLFSAWWIRQAIINAIIEEKKNIFDMPDHIIESINAVNRTSQCFVQETGREPTSEEIAKEMGIPINQVQSILRLEAGFEIQEDKNEELIEVDSESTTDESIPILVKKIIKNAKKIKMPGKEVYKRVKPFLKTLSEEQLRKRVEISSNKQLKKQVSVEKIHEQIVHLKRDTVFSQISISAFSRNPYVAELAKRKAKGICQLCENPAPFNDKDGKPYLETHHIVWLSEGGEDTIENCTALCPNCHQKMHILNLKFDIAKLLSKTMAEIPNS